MNSNAGLMKPKNDGLRASITSDAIILKSQLVSGHESGCGIFSSCSSSMLSETGLTVIPYDNILWLEKYGDEEGEVEINYVVKPQYGNLKLHNCKIYVEDIPPSINEPLDQYIIDHSFSDYKFHTKKLLVLINPHGGQGKALQYFEENCKPILKAAHCKFEIVTTQYHRHAIDLLRDLDLNKYDCIICASGDGIPHEIINGLYQRKDPLTLFQKLTIAQLPCGSGNALSFSCFGTLKLSELTLLLLKSKVVRTDAMAVTQGTGDAEETKLSFLTQTYGIIADSDIGTEWLRWMGPVRFDIGVTLKVIQKSSYPCDIYVKYVAKDKNSVMSHYDTHLGELSLSQHPRQEPPATEESMVLKYPSLDQDVPQDWEQIDEDVAQHLGIFYVGKMPYIAKDLNFFPLALPNDGSMDLVITDARTNFFSMAESLLSLEKGTHVLNKNIQHSKILAYRLVPRMYHTYISVDGESFPLEPMQVEVIPGLLQMLMTNGVYTDTGFNK